MGAVPSITLFREAVVAPLAGHDAPHHDPAAAIVSEIAERLEELDAIKRESAADLVMQLAAIAGTSRRAFRVTVQLLHGNLDEVLASYQEQADRRGVTKQDIHYEFTQEIGRLRRSFPELHRCILAMRAQAQNHEDPMAKAEIANPSGGGGLE